MLKMVRSIQFISIIAIILALAIVTTIAVPITGAQGVPPEPPFFHSHNMVLKTIPISFEMEAGTAWYDVWSDGHTVHSGVGSVQPFGAARYWAGVNYTIAQSYPQPSYMDASWKSNIISTGLFCIYRLDDGSGEFYAYDGIIKNLQPAAQDDGKMDYLINVIVGGTGVFKGATGVLLGSTPGRGATQSGGLPVNILKIMSGYVNIYTKNTRGMADQYSVLDLRNPQVNPDSLTQFAAGKLIPVNLEMEAGAAQYNTWTSGTTQDAGIGWIEPFGRTNFWAVTGPSETSTFHPSYMNSDFVKTYNTGDNVTSTFCIYQVRNTDNTADSGLIYAYEGVVGNLARFGPDDGGMDYVVDWVVGGTDNFTDAKGVLMGTAVGRGYDAATGLPDSLLKCMSGYVIKK